MIDAIAAGLTNELSRRYPRINVHSPQPNLNNADLLELGFSWPTGPNSVCYNYIEIDAVNSRLILHDGPISLSEPNCFDELFRRIDTIWKNHPYEEPD